MTPATAFTKAVCERASKDGWQLFLCPQGYQWTNGNRSHQGDLYGYDARYDLWAACHCLADNEYPDLQVIID